MPTPPKPGRQLCTICGAADATTLDHLPPKNLFPKPRPSDLITVPSCLRCNNVGSKHDEEFRVFVSIQLGMETDTTRKLWKEGALRTIHHNNRLRSHLITNSREVDVVTPAGISLGKRRAVTVPMRSHNAVCDRIVRGLYFHHYGAILGSRVSCHVAPLQSIPSEVGPILSLMSFNSIADGAFCYQHGRAADSPLDSMWFLLFYDKYLVMVETRSKSRSNPTVRRTLRDKAAYRR